MNKHNNSPTPCSHCGGADRVLIDTRCPGCGGAGQVDNGMGSETCRGCGGIGTIVVR